MTFSVTHWPGVPVPVPPVPVYPVRALDGGLLFEEPGGRIVGESTWHLVAEVPTIELPPELYLRGFLPLDVTSLDDVLAFCRQYGRVDDPYGRTLAPAVFAAPDMSPQEMDEWISRAEDKKARRVPRSEPPQPDPPVVWLDEVACYHASLSNMVLMWRRLEGDIDAAELQDRWLPAGGPVPAAASLTSERLADRLGEYLYPALSTFRIRVGSPHGDPFAAVPLTVYEAMCLQLANHIAEGLPYLHCAAPDCRNLFVRTEGYSRHGQNRLRGGSNKFCSVRCADRVRQREYRRRKQDASDANSGTRP